MVIFNFIRVRLLLIVQLNEMASRRKKKKNPWASETQKFEEFMYENKLENQTIQFSQYHWRIKTFKGKVDIWPGSKKYYTKGISNKYKELNELLTYIK